MHFGFCIYGVDRIHQKSSLNGQEPNDHSTHIRLLTEKVSKILSEYSFLNFFVLSDQILNFNVLKSTRMKDYQDFSEKYFTPVSYPYVLVRLRLLTHVPVRA